MNKTIESLSPRQVWKHFSEICQIPHPSGHIGEIAAYLVKFGKNLHLETEQDAIGNVLIKKPATAGMENCPTVILQAHMDMVPQKNSDVQHDFIKDPIDAYVDGEWVTARNTTLGADNGIGMASILGVLASDDLKHGPIEAVFTVDEETGMDGARNLQPGWLEGKILINTDSEEEGELYIGCAGGLNMQSVFRYRENTDIPSGYLAIKLSLTGLKGGHSGIDINAGRANANKLLFRFLKHAVRHHGARLAFFEGGNLRNAIPREAFATILIPEENKEKLLEELRQYESVYKHEYAPVENELTFSADPAEMPDALLPELIQDDIINAVVGCQNGVARTMAGHPDIVECSSNLAIVKSEKEQTTAMCLLRSASETMKADLASSLESVFSLAGAKTEFSGGYPGWEPDFHSPVLELMKEIYKKKFGKEARTEVIHAGLECGIIGSIYPGLDMISFGPTLRHPHSPDEKVDIESVKRFWEFLTATLENIPCH